MGKARRSEAPAIVGDPGFDILSLFAEREAERYTLHARHLNEMMVRVLQTIGYDVGFCSGHGQYLFDRAGLRYLDLLSGWGVFGIGRNHPIVREVLTDILDHDLPNLVQMDVSPLAALLAERLLRYTPFLQKAFFTNSGAEAVEAAIKFSRRATTDRCRSTARRSFATVSGPSCPTASRFRSTISRHSKKSSPAAR